MKKLYAVASLLIVALSCQPKENILPDYPGWYSIKSPERQPAQAVYGDLDGTLIVASLFTIYFTTNKGKSWQLANYPPNADRSLRLGLFGFAVRNDTLIVLNSTDIRSTDPVHYAADPFYYSLDKGVNWQRYKGIDRVRSPINSLRSSSGTTYAVREKLIPVPNSTRDFYVLTTGVYTSDNRELTLPQRHQIKSLAFDSKQRLMIAASAPLCNTPPEDFKFCGDDYGRIYISKEAQP